MNLVEWLQRLMTNFGAEWVMWLMFVLSIISVAIMLERGWFYFSLRDDIARLARDLRDKLRANDLEGARKGLESSPSAEAAVVSAGLLEADHGSKAAEEAMEGAAALQRMKLSKRLAFLGTLGNNAPFIGLFGTVIGVVQAFEHLGKQGMAPGAQAVAATSAPQEVMAAIAEALVATAIGLAVAIPAVAMYNYFQSLSKGILANTEALRRVLLAHLAAVESGKFQPAPVAARSGEGRRRAPADEGEDEG
ncbi:MAG TPA: MotA/TolQ/ExbB proton channel family protein [Polyangiaceae bacterium]|jgi:biopolymer transport protein ExbB|nr:MotA/TolQ/ExbB proton channel family protein [Polyangiaceae bacterium]